MKKCKHTCPRLQRLKRSSHEKIRNWASIALDAVENDKVHDYWSNVITEPVRKEELQLLKGRAPAIGGELTKLARYVNYFSKKRHILSR